MAGPSRGSDDHVEMAVPSPVVSPISTFVLNTLTLKKVHFFSVVSSPAKRYLHFNTGPASSQVDGY